MQVSAQDFLRLIEPAGTLAFVDIESSGFRGDYNSILCVSVKPHGREPVTFSAKQAGNDQQIVRLAKEALEAADCWVTYYGKGFDIPMLNTRLLKWGMRPIDKRPHIDMYYQLKSKLLTSRRSQAHMLDWLETPVRKMSVSADAWVAIIRDIKKEMPQMIERCESDVAGLEALYDQTKHLIEDIKR